MYVYMYVLQIHIGMCLAILGWIRIPRFLDVAPGGGPPDRRGLCASSAEVLQGGEQIHR